jgi:hypothetical protein
VPPDSVFYIFFCSFDSSSDPGCSLQSLVIEARGVSPRVPVPLVGVQAAPLQVTPCDLATWGKSTQATQPLRSGLSKAISNLQRRQKQSMLGVCSEASIKQASSPTFLCTQQDQERGVPSGSPWAWLHQLLLACASQESQMQLSGRNNQDQPSRVGEIGSARHLLMFS